MSTPEPNMPKLMVMTGKAPCGEQQPRRCSGAVGSPSGSSKTTLLDRPKGLSMMRIAFSRPHLDGSMVNGRDIDFGTGARAAEALL